MLQQRDAAWARTLARFEGGAAAVPTVHVAPSARPWPLTAPSRVVVAREDTLDAAARLHGGGARVAVLNMADAAAPGGAVACGGGMQEESLFRRTSLWLSLGEPRAPRRGLYPICDGAAVLSRAVQVWLAGERGAFAPLARPFAVDVISCPGVKLPPLLPAAPPRMAAEDADRVAARVRAIGAAAAAAGCDALVLGALGCGAFGCPPHHVAAIFKAEIDTDALPPRVRAVVFAVLGADNAAPFEAVFGAEGS
jgi:uncharacterized protein (TIGR02452 family)